MIIIPVTNQPNQSFSISVPVDDVNLNLRFFFFWNEITEYWQMDVSDNNTGAMLISALPMVGGDDPAGNILHQFDYLGLGEAYILPLSDDVVRTYPGVDDWGTNFVLIWG